MEQKMNKEIFLRDLRRFLSDLPEEEREQAVKYYEDYFEDAGPEKEQQVIQELGNPVDIARQIKAVNPDRIEYGQGTDFHRSAEYPQVSGDAGFHYGNSQQAEYSQNSSFGQHTEEKKKWTQDSGKVALVVILAVLAIPVGIPLVSAAFGILLSVLSVIAGLTAAILLLGGGLAVGGLVSTIASFFLLPAGSIANFILVLGIGLTLFSLGVMIFWAGIIFCAKFYPAFFSALAGLCQSIWKKCRKFFS